MMAARTAGIASAGVVTAGVAAAAAAAASAEPYLPFARGTHGQGIAAAAASGGSPSGLFSHGSVGSKCSISLGEQSGGRTINVVDESILTALDAGRRATAVADAPPNRWTGGLLWMSGSRLAEFMVGAAVSP